jgi:Domain of unknown function (DUF4082)
MKKFLLVLSIFSASAFATPAVTNVSISSVSHSVTRIITSYTGSPNNLRMRFIQSPGTCTGMTGGIVQPSSWNGVGNTLPTNPIGQSVGGLLPNTTYSICPEISEDGSNWFGGVSVSVTTLPLPNPHPAPPIAPATFDTSYPDTTGFTTYTMNSSCLDSSTSRTLVQRINDAIANQKAHGTLITIPAGTTCTGQIYPSVQAQDVYSFAATAVSTTANTITITSHGFTEGQGLKFGTQYGCLPGSDGNQNNCETTGHGPIIPGWVYHACNVTTNTFQVCQLPIAQGGTPFTFSNAGNGTELVMPWPRSLNWIIIRTAAPDNQFVPQGVRLQGPMVAASQSSFASTAPVNWAPTPPTNWLPKMAVLRMPNLFSGTSGANVLFAADGTNYEQTAYIRFVGIQFTYTPDPTGGLSSNVTPHFDMVGTNQWNDDIIFDRCWFHALPPPDRVNRAFWWNGANMAIINSYLDNLQFYHPVHVGGAVSKIDYTHFTVNSFNYNWGKGLYRSPDQIAVSTSGTNGASNQSALIYMDTFAAPAVKIVLPPGITGTCTAGTYCNVYTGSTNGVFNAVGSFPGGTGGAASGNNYWVDPIFSTSSTCTATQTLLSGDPNPGAGTFHSGNSDEAGVRFSPDTNGYVCGIRFYKNSSETGTHIGNLWNDAAGTLLATGTFTGETASGWQTLTFSSPVAVTANTMYVVSYGTNVGLLLSSKYWQNYPLDGGHLHAPAHYVNSSGSYNYNDNWPKNWLGNTMAAQLGYVTFNAGAIVGQGNADSTSQQWDTEGCQCMVGGLGPGPYIFSNNFIEATGTVWHHDDGGGDWAIRGDYTYTRNYAISPKSQMASTQNSEWDGLEYFHRHMFEWKSGCRINFSGNVYGGAWLEDTPIGDMIEFAADNGCGLSDLNVQYNTFAHGAILFWGPSAYPGTGGSAPNVVKSYPPLRFRFQHNLTWDINGNTWCAHGFGFCQGVYSSGGWGVLFDLGDDDEDWIIDHNTFTGLAGQEADFLWTTEGVNEGFNFTSNILWIPGTTAQYSGIDSGNTCSTTTAGNDSQCYGSTKYCRTLTGWAGWNCALLNSTLDRNLLMGSPTQSQIQGIWPTVVNGSNYIPSNPGDFSSIGWFKYGGSTDVKNNYRFRGSSPYISGGHNPAADGSDVGANIDAMEAAQGIVTLNGVSNITTAGAQVNFIAPDSQGCSVDYSSTDSTLTSSFTRVTDAGGSNRVRNIALTGLSSGTEYFFRINCQVQQLTGQFRTH